MKKSIAFILSTILLLTLSNCSKDEDKAPEDFLFKGVSVIQTNDTDFEYIANDKDGNMVFFDWGIDHVKKAICRDKNGEWVEMHFNEQGYPKYVYSEDHIVVIDNIKNSKADFAVIELNSGKINILREVDFDLKEYNVIKSASATNIIGGTSSWFGKVAEGLKLASISLAAFSLTTAYVGLAVGPHSPVALALSGTSIVLSAIAAASSEYFEELEASAMAFSVGADAIGCGVGDGVACVGLGTTITAGVMAVIDENQENIQLVEGVLEYGYGDVQVTLTWDNIADLDLHIIDPNGEEIFWENEFSYSNGVLDVDDIDGYGPENIYWPKYEAPSGNYKVYVRMFPWIESQYIYVTGNSYYPNNSNYTVLVTAFGETKKFSGSISYGVSKHIIDFDQNGLKSASLKSASLITEKNKKYR